ncbi:MAG: hypothetical protein LBP61_07725 [Desulfovibrio sp.]|jgi:hypothetical protein|nr:hypothetical protein [Desulfovibrio sp.]
MDFPAVFYVPLFRRANAPGDIPDGLAFFRAGLEAGEPVGAGEEDFSARALEAAFAARLPLSPDKARAALAEMLALGRDLSGAGVLLQQAAREQRVPALRADQGQEEFAALEFFARNGNPPPRLAEVPDSRRILVACQKILLLARALEEDRLEIADLVGRLSREEQSLRAFFGEGEGEPFVPDVLFPDAPPWRVILDAALPFLPEEALLFTADPFMSRDLRAAGLLRPLPEDLAVRCPGWPEATLAGLLLAEVPAWRLLGRRFLPPDRPWLARVLTVLVRRPGCPEIPAPGRRGREK